MNFSIKSEIREKKEKKNDNIPVVLYGGGGENVSLWVDRIAFEKVLDKAGESTLIELTYEKGEKEKNDRILIQELQYSPLGGEIIHADLLRVRMDEEIETDVELEFVGESKAVKELGGTFLKNIDSISIKCFPGDLLSKVEVDISSIETFDDYIRVKDLKLSSKIEIQTDPETIIASVSAPRTQEELESLNVEVEADITKIEGMEKKEEVTTEGEKGKEKKGKEKSGK